MSWVDLKGINMSIGHSLFHSCCKATDEALGSEHNAAGSCWGKSVLWHPFGWEYAESRRWNRLERFYIRLFGLVDLPSRIRARLIQKVLEDIPWKTMIDFGCGTGAYCYYFSRFPGVRVWGVDIDNSRISDCIELNRKLERKSLDFVRASSIFQTDRFQSNSIDVVLAIEVLQCLRNVQAGFQEIQRVLKAGGYFVGHFPMLGYMRPYETILFDTEKIERFVQEAGLEPVSITRVFGRTERFLCWIFGQCCRSRILAAITFPLLLTASLLCGDENASGSHCLVVARKTQTNA